MDFALTEEQQELEDLSRRILTDRTDHDRLKDVEATEERFDRELWAMLAEANLLGVAVPEDLGGLGFGLTELGIVAEQIGWAVPLVPAVPTFAFLLAVCELASDDLATSLVPEIVAGSTVVSVAAVEGDGALPLRPGTTARRDGDAWVLDGTKICVPYAHVAGVLLVTASAGDDGTGLFLVDPRAEGVTVTRTEVTNLEPQFVVSFDGVAVARERVVAVGADSDPVRRLVDVTTALMCVTALGVADRAMHIAAEYARERHQFDVPIGSFQAVHTRIADAFVNVTAMRLTAWQAIWRLAEGLDATDELDIAKFWASDAAFQVTFAAIHLHGGIGVDVDYPLHRYYLWAKTLELGLGSATPHLAALGARMAAAPA